MTSFGSGQRVQTPGETSVRRSATQEDGAAVPASAAFTPTPPCPAACGSRRSRPPPPPEAPAASRGDLAQEVRGQAAEAGGHEVLGGHRPQDDALADPVRGEGNQHRGHLRQPGHEPVAVQGLHDDGVGLAQQVQAFRREVGLPRALRQALLRPQLEEDAVDAVRGVGQLRGGALQVVPGGPALLPRQDRGLLMR